MRDVEKPLLPRIPVCYWVSCKSIGFWLAQTRYQLRIAPYYHFLFSFQYWQCGDVEGTSSRLPVCTFSASIAFWLAQTRLTNLRHSPYYSLFIFFFGYWQLRGRSRGTSLHRLPGLHFQCKASPFGSRKRATNCAIAPYYSLFIFFSVLAVRDVEGTSPSRLPVCTFSAKHRLLARANALPTAP